MIDQAKGLLASVGWLFATTRRCNYVGGALCTLILLASAWTYRNADSFADDPRFSEQQLREAKALLANADAVRSRNATQFIRMNQNQLRLAKMKGWLVTEYDWQKSSAHIEALASQANVKIVSLDNAIQHKGKRVAVDVIQCECEADFSDICRFLYLLCNDQSAAWCDSIRLYRNRIDEQGDDQDDVECNASISIRIPTVGSKTAAAQLLSMEPPNVI